MRWQYVRNKQGKHELYSAGNQAHQVRVADAGGTGQAAGAGGEV